MRLARGTVEARKRQVTEPLLTFDGFRIGDILEELTLYGATSVKMLPENLRSSLLVEAEGYSLGLPPGLTQTVKTLFAVRWKSLDQQDD